MPFASQSPWWHLFDVTPFVTRDHCGDWPGWLIVAWIIPSLAIAAVYLGVVVWEVWVCRAARGTTYPRWASLSVAAFFFGCAGGHLMNALAFHWPAYRAFVLWDWYTMAASVVGVFAIRRLTRWQDSAVADRRIAERLARETAAILDAEQAKAERLRIALLQANTQLTLLGHPVPGGVL